jgi:hypothetical protein
VTTRDRTVLIAVLLLAALGAAWMLVVSPERQKASAVNAQVSAAKAQLSTAEGELNSARTGESKYAAAYGSLVSLGKAVPAGDEVPALIFQLSVASAEKNVDFASIVATNSGSGSTSPSASSASSTGASGSTSAASASASLTQMPFTFVFNGGFFSLERLFGQLTALTDRTPTGALRISGRLLTIQSVKLAPVSTGSEAHKGANTELSGTITATAYVLPAGQSLSAVGSSSSSSAVPASAAGASTGSTTAPAIVKVGP